MADFKVHRVRFFEFTPLTINCLAFDKATQRLAVSRSDGSIEVWSKADNWFQEKVIAVAEEQSVEGVVWMNSRLFSAGLDSNVVEYDLSALTVKRQASSSAGAIWCIAKNEDDQQLAVGTEDGCVVLFDAAEDKLEYLRSFDKLEGRILCIAWHTGESVVVTGGVDNIRLWSVTSGHALQRITMGRDTIVWSIAITSDMTIISGDSRGKVTFWNGKQGTRITHFQSHRADVLTVCVDETESSVFCSGVDHSVVQFSYLASGSSGGWRSWVRGSVRTYHTHDVRACVVAGNTIVTGGVDTNLMCSQINNKKKRFIRHSSVPSMSMVGVAKKTGLVMLRYPTYLEVWRLGHTEASSSVNGDVLPLKFEPVKLVQLKARAGERITCSAISQDGTVCAFSDQEKIRVYRMTVEDKNSLSPKVSLSRLPLSPAPNGGTAQRLVIAPGNRRLVAATGALCVQIWDISGDKGTLLHSLQPLAAGLGDSKHHSSFTNLCVSEDGKMAASSDSGGGVHLYRLDDPQVVCRLPSMPCQASAVNFSLGSKSLLVAYANHKVVEFDVHKQEYCAWSRQSRFPDQWFRQRGFLRGVTTQPSSPSTLFLHSDHNIMVIRRSQPMPEKDYVLFTGETTSQDSSPRPLVACTKYKLILHVDFLDADSLVVVERTPLSIQDKLAPALKAKKFGT